MAQNPKLEKAVKQLVYYDVDFQHHVGIMVGIVEGDSTYIYRFGETEMGNGKLIPKDAVFEIGSNTKVFLSALTQILVDEGQLQWTDSIGQYLNPSECSKSLARKTLLNLATHTSGLPRMPTNFIEKEQNPTNPYANYTTTDLIDFLKNYEVSLRKGRYQYAHVNYAVLEYILEKHTQQSLEQLLQTKVFQPLGMPNTSLLLSEVLQQKMTPSYDLTGKKVAPWVCQTFKGALGLKSSMPDLLQFVQANLNTTLLTASLEKTHEPHYNTFNKKVNVAKGWHLVRPKKRHYSIISHQGITNGHQVYIGMIKETKTGVVVFSNTKNDLKNLGFYMLKMLNRNWKRKAGKKQNYK